MIKYTKLALTAMLSCSVLLTTPVWGTRGSKSDNGGIVDLSEKHTITTKKFRSLILKTINKSKSGSGIDLSRNAFDDKTIKKMSKTFKSNRNVKTLILVECDINGAQAIRLFEEIFPFNNSLENLDLRNNKITGMGIVSLSRVLPRNTVLTTLDLSHNPIGPEVGPQIEKALQGNHHLKTLKLGEVGLNDIALGHIVKGLNDNTSLSDLDLSDNSLGNGGALNIEWVLARNNTLQSINLSQCQIKDFGLKAIGSGLKKNKGILELKLAGNLFNKEAIDKFEKRITKAGFTFDREKYIATRAVFPEKAEKKTKSKKLLNGNSQTKKHKKSPRKSEIKENGGSDN